MSYAPGSGLEGATAIVTGGGNGIGKVYARALAAKGARVVVAELDAKAGEDAVAELTASGMNAVAVVTDVGDEDSVKRMVAGAIDHFGQVDILVNNAAIFTSVPLQRNTLTELSVAEFERVMRVNVTGTWLCCRAVVPDMRLRSYGKIVNISSSTVFKGIGADMIHYVTSKSAVLGMTRTLARELGRDGIRVNCVAPGLTVTPGMSGGDWEKRAEIRVAARAIPRLERPEDLAGTIVFLASPESDFITGQTFVVDGGEHML